MLLRALWENNVEECRRLYAEGERLRPEEYTPELTFDQVVFAFMHLDAERVWAGRITHPYLWARLIHTKAFVCPPRTLPYMILQQSMWKGLGWTPEVDDLDAMIEAGMARLNATFQAKFPFRTVVEFDNAAHEFRSQMTYWLQTKADLCSVLSDSLCRAVDLRLASESPLLTEEERACILDWMTSAIKAYPVTGTVDAFLRGEYDAIFESARSIPDKNRLAAIVMKVALAYHVSVHGEPTTPNPFAAPAGSSPSNRIDNPFLPSDGTNPFAEPAGTNPYADPTYRNPFAAPAGMNPYADPAYRNPFAAPPGMNPFGGRTPYADPAYRNPFSAPPGMNPFAAPPGLHSSTGIKHPYGDVRPEDLAQNASSDKPCDASPEKPLDVRIEPPE